MFTLSYTFGAGAPGLSLKAALVDTSGTIHATHRDIATGFVEIGNGYYGWSYTLHPDGFRGSAVFYVGTVGAAADFAGVTVRGAAPVNPEEAEHLDAKVSGVSTAVAAVAAAVAGIPAAVWSAATRTLTASILTAADVWAYATRTLTSPATASAAAAEGRLAIRRGDKWTQQLTGLGSLTGRTKLWLTVKRSTDDADADAVLQMTEAGGLLVVNGEAVTGGGTAAGTITVDDEDAGDVTITLTGARTAELTPETGLLFDVQLLETDADPVTKAEGYADVSADVTRAVA